MKESDKAHDRKQEFDIEDLSASDEAEGRRAGSKGALPSDQIGVVESPDIEGSLYQEALDSGSKTQQMIIPKSNMKIK